MNQAERAKLHELAKQVASHLGYAYAGKNGFEDGELYECATIVKEEIGSFYFSQYNGRITVTVSYPRDDKTNRYYNVSQYRVNGRTSEISVSATKAPEQIAKDITRRLLPGGESLYQEALADMHRDQDYTAGKQSTAANIAALLGKTINPRHLDPGAYPSFYFFGTDAEVTISGPKYIKVKVDLKSAEEFEKLLTALKSIKQGAAD